ncbi:MAG: hypothetical protein ACTTKH_07665 [Treponema sp.]
MKKMSFVGGGIMCFKYFSKFFLLISISFFGCATLQTEWKKDASNIKNEVKKEGKDAFLLFTGSDWDEESQTLLNMKSENKLFAKYNKDFLFYNIDIVRNEEAMNDRMLKNNYTLFSIYNVGDLPHVAVRSFEGDVYFSKTLEKPYDLDKVALEVLEKKAFVKKLKNDIKEKEGKEKTIAIDAFFSNIYNSEHIMYDELRKLAIESDAKNESGLIGKFKVFVANLKAEKLVLQKKYLEAADEYILLLKETELDKIDRQNAWYQIAFLYANSKKIANEKIVFCLTNAINAYPESDGVGHLKEIIKSIEKN